MNEHTIVYFGYGSLVNRDTRPPDEPAARARLRGWHRIWEHRVSASASRQPSCSLSIAPDWIRTEVDVPAGCEPGLHDGTSRGIDGVVVPLPIEALAVLDAREEGYERLTLPATEFDLPAGLDVEEIHVYRSLLENRVSATDEHPILQTYVDCCMAGFLNVYGECGLDNFLHATRGWGGQIENDRTQPRYPRAVAIPGDMLARFDRLVNARREGCLLNQ